MTGLVELSIVTTLYRSADTIEQFIQRSLVAAELVTQSFEIVVVDDGSPDDSLAIGIMHITQPVPALPDALGAFQPLLDRLLAKQPEDRFQTGNEAAAAFWRSRWLTSRSFHTRGAPATRESWRERR